MWMHGRVNAWAGEWMLGWMCGSYHERRAIADEDITRFS